MPVTEVSTDQKLMEFLVQENFLTQKQAKSLQEEAKGDKKPLENLLLEKSLVKDESLGQVIADIHEWNFVNLRKEAIDETVLKLIP
ncbi:MAG: hypothetical protein V1760_03960, partial [Candidatus Peregrinibacteria bacterium]